VALEKFPKKFNILGEIWELVEKGLDSHRSLRFHLKRKKSNWEGKLEPHPNQAFN